MTDSPLLDAWRERGTHLDWRGHQIFTVDVGPRTDHAVVILHGFPSSSLDWEQVVPMLEDEVRVVTFDMLGFGLSDKPADGTYTIMAQADLAEHVCASLGVTSALLVSHDMGQTVGAELVVRSTSGALDLELTGHVVTNGSTLIDLAQLSPVQEVWLAAPDEQTADPEDLEELMPLLQFTFGPDHQPTEDELRGMQASIVAGGGDRLLPRLVRYVNDRRANLDRWTAGLVEHDLPMTVAWGELDPIAVVAMAHRMKELRPSLELVTWPDVAHWPSIEVPARVAEVIRSRL